MYRIGNVFKSRLTWYLAGCVLLSGLVSGIVGYTLFYFGSDYIERICDDQSVNRTWQENYMEDLQEFVDKQQIAADNIAGLKEWTDENAYVYLSVYQNRKIIFNSDYIYVEAAELEESFTQEEVDEDDSEYLYRLELADGSVAKVDMFCYDYWKYTYYVFGVAVVIGIGLFVLILTRLIQRKIRYINEISKELQILEGGNLEYPITIKGQDEIANLARGIEQMRLSILENMKKEKEILQGNKDLVTSMSHDLRTPLTTLIGYLELLERKPMADEATRKKYAQLSLAKSREIKDMSDDLFEYFLIYGENEKKIEVEPIPAAALVDELIGNQLLGLEEEGYVIDGLNNISEEDGNCMMNVQYMKRVLNNLISNLEKYADKAVPIEVSANIEQNYMVIRLRNGINRHLEPHESTKIGLITCERIMELHHGEFQKFETEDEFTVKLVIPMENIK